MYCITVRLYCDKRDSTRAQTIFHCILRLLWQYSHSQLPLLVNILSYSRGPIFPWVWPTEEPSTIPLGPRGYTDLHCPSWGLVLKNTLGLEGYIETAIFQYSIVMYLRMVCKRTLCTFSIRYSMSLTFCYVVYHFVKIYIKGKKTFLSKKNFP